MTGRDGMILVTGATGTVGSEVVRELVGRDADVRAASRDVDAARDRLAVDADDATVEYVDFDFTRPETYYPALVDADRVFLVRPPAVSSIEENLVPFVDAAARMGVDHVTLLSVLGAEKNPLLPHRRMEKHLEGLAVNGSLTYTFLRASFFMQNLLTQHRGDIVENDRISLPAGDGATSFVDARDLGAVAALTLTEPDHENRAYDLTGPAALTYHEVAEVFTEELGREITYADSSLPTFVATELRRGRSLAFTLVMAGIYTTARLGFTGRVTDDVERLLDRQPRSVREFVRDNAAAFAAVESVPVEDA